MAKYTTQIRSIVESGTPIFDFDYPIFDEAYRPVLEQKILDTYYFREIGLETVGQFKHFLKNKLQRIMPYYNEQYRALEVFKTYDPYINKDMTTTQKRTSTQESDVSTKSTGSGKSIFSDTPQARLEGKDYATNLNEDDSETTGESTGTATTTDEYIETIKGFDGMKYASEVYLGVKETIINLDQMIIDELSDLFMNVY